MGRCDPGVRTVFIASLSVLSTGRTKENPLSSTADHQPPDEAEYVFRASITLPNGRKLFAHHYGLKAFKIPIRPDNDNRTGKRKGA